MTATEGLGAVAASNEQQASAWNAGDGDHWVAFEDRYNAAVVRYEARLLDGARIARDDRVLDIGCGCGESTRDAARVATDGSALGADLSQQMIARARERATQESLTNVTFEAADAQVYPFAGASFDVAISRFGAMFFGDPVAAFSNVARALVPHGRLAILAWQALGDNEWLREILGALAMGRTLPEPPPEAPSPFSLATPDRVRALLGAAGFVDVDLEEVAEPLSWGSNADDAFAFVSSIGPVRGLLQDLDEHAQAQALDQLRAVLAAHQTSEGVTIGSRAWLITARAKGGKP